MDLAAALARLVEEHRDQINQTAPAEGDSGWVEISVRVDVNGRMRRVVPAVTVKEPGLPARRLDRAA